MESSPPATLPAVLTKEDLPPLLLLVAAIAIFTYGWTAYGWQLYLTLRLPVFDFGINSQIVWAGAHGAPIDFFGVGAGSLLLYLFVPVLWVLGPHWPFVLFLLAFQAAWLAAGAIPLYLVARDQPRLRAAALALALAYLAFPAIAGSVWYPVHFEALFPTLFLFGYWQYRRGAWWGAGGFWTAALFTQIGGVIVLGFAALGILVEPRLTGWLAYVRRRLPLLRAASAPTSEPSVGPTGFQRMGGQWLGAYLLIAAVVVFLGVATFYAWPSFLHYVTKTGPSSASFSEPIFGSPSSADWPLVGWTLLLLLGPLLVLPVFGREERWGLIPYFAAVFLLDQHGFWYPFRNQYPSLLVGPLFAATVRGLERLRDRRSSRDPAAVEVPTDGRYRWRRARPHLSSTGVCGVILLVVVVSGVFIAPWGPFNPNLRSNGFLAPGYFNDSGAYSSNLTLDAQIRHLAESVPAGGAVLTQDNLIEPLDRAYYTIPSRMTTSTPIQYLLTDPYSVAFYSHQFDGPLNTSMEQWADYFLARGWGVMGEAEGAVLLAANYSGGLRTYSPIDQSFDGSESACCNPGALTWNGSRSATWLAGPSVPYDGVYNVFSPGWFNLTLHFEISNPGPKDRMVCSVSGAHGQVPLATFNITRGAFQAVNGTVQMSYAFHSSNYTLYPHIALRVAKWTGSLTLIGIDIRQTGPP